MTRSILYMCVSLTLLVALGIPAEPSASQAADPAPTFAAFVDDYFDAYFAWKPSEGTGAGFHQYDTKLEDWSAAAFAKRIETINAQLIRLDSLRRDKLPADAEIDAEVLDGLLRAELLDLESLFSGPGDALAVGDAIFAELAQLTKPDCATLRACQSLVRIANACVKKLPI